MIKLFEQYNEYNRVEDWLKEMSIENYTINEDLIVDVSGSVDIRGCILSEIPIQFGRVELNFYCQNNFLKSLKGCPSYVGKTFKCNNNLLTNLEYSPKYIKGNFHLRENKITTLKGSPIEVGGEFDYYENPLPIVILDFENEVRYGHIKDLIKYQDEYGIWNSDGTLNKARFSLFKKDFETGTLD